MNTWQRAIREHRHEGLVVDISVGGCSFELNMPANGKFPVMKIGIQFLKSQFAETDAISLKPVDTYIATVK